MGAGEERERETKQRNFKMKFLFALGWWREFCIGSEGVFLKNQEKLIPSLWHARFGRCRENNERVLVLNEAIKGYLEDSGL